MVYYILKGLPANLEGVTDDVLIYTNKWTKDGLVELMKRYKKSKSTRRNIQNVGAFKRIHDRIMNSCVYIYTYIYITHQSESV